jgi:hypothetical protein
MKTLILLTSLLGLLVHTEAQNPPPAENYTNEAILQAPDFYYLYWRNNDTDVQFEIHYKNTLTWVMFGLQGLQYSDLVFGWVNNDSTGHFSDRKMTNQNVTTVDQSQDWYILDAFIKNNYKVLIFTRKIKLLCGTDMSQQADDLDIQPGSANQIIYASGLQVDNYVGSVLDFTTYSVMAPFTVLTQSTPNQQFSCVAKQAPIQFTSTPTGIYANYIDLIDGIYRLYWNYTATDFIGEIHCKTSGWVGFGLSPNGGMDGSDVIVGWITADGKVDFSDRHIVGKSVIRDVKQDWKLLNYGESNGYTIFKFTRPIVLCDPNDRTIEVINYFN